MFLSRCGGDAPLVDLSTHIETNYYQQGSSQAQQPREQKQRRNAETAGHRAKAKKSPGDTNGDAGSVKKIRHINSFRLALLSSSQLRPVGPRRA
jgi:hypothetical protein